jgi:hypothetical protein
MSGLFLYVFKGHEINERTFIVAGLKKPPKCQECDNPDSKREFIAAKLAEPV